MERHLDEALDNFKQNLLKMGALTEASLGDCIKALRNRDEDLAEHIILNDSAIDEYENIIEEQAIELHARFQPMAVDLRYISAGQHISTDIERIADLVVNIAQRIVDGHTQLPSNAIRDIPHLAEHARKMTTKAIDAFIKQDAELAQETILADKTANDLRSSIIQELMDDYIKGGGETALGAVSLVMITRDLERIADHATAIAEEVIYMTKAKMIKHHLDELQNE